ATTWCAVMFMVCALALVVRVDRGVDSNGSILQQYSKPAPAKSAPVTPAPTQSTPQSSTPQTPAPSTPVKK
ncbi:MAG: hypothetical protein WAM58_07045, partial [Candidatus Acidiferrum sp.]